MALFFGWTHQHIDLSRALQAYGKAEENGGGSNPDLFFNKAEVLRYREEFALAAAAFQKAADLDPSLPGEEAVQAIERRVRRTIDLLEKTVGGWVVGWVNG